MYDQSISGAKSSTRTLRFVARSISMHLVGGIGRSPLHHCCTVGGLTPTARAKADLLPRISQASRTACCGVVFMDKKSRLCLESRQGIAETFIVPYIQAMPNPLEHIGDRLRREMDRLGLTPTEVANIFGVKNPSVYDWMKFGRVAKKHIPKLVEVFGHTAEWWITGKEEANPAPFPAITSGGLADRIGYALEESGVSVHDLAVVAGTTEEVIGGYLKGEITSMRVEEAVAIQEKYGISSVWLLLGKGPKTVAIRHNDDYKPIPVTGWRGIPVVGMAQLGDNGFWADIEYPVGHGDGFVDVPTKDKDAYALKCKGDSMRPRIKDNEYVVCEPNHEIQPGDEVLVKAKDGRVMVKEFIYEAGGRVHLLSVNETHGKLSIERADIEKMHYVGWIAKPSAWRPD